MDWLKPGSILPEHLKKYRWAVIVLLVGLALMAMPKPEESATLPVQPETVQQDLGAQLESLLSALEGAGKVRVLLTPATGEQVLYQSDENKSQTADSRDLQVQTVIVTGGDRAQTGLVRRVDPPTYQGAVVLCQGADSAAVRLRVVEAVRTATGLTADKIAVLKMK